MGLLKYLLTLLEIIGGCGLAIVFSPLLAFIALFIEGEENNG